MSRLNHSILRESFKSRETDNPKLVYLTSHPRDSGARYTCGVVLNYRGIITLLHKDRGNPVTVFNALPEDVIYVAGEKPEVLKECYFNPDNNLYRVLGARKKIVFRTPFGKLETVEGDVISVCSYKNPSLDIVHNGRFLNMKRIKSKTILGNPKVVSMEDV